MPKEDLGRPYPYSMEYLIAGRWSLATRRNELHPLGNRRKGRAVGALGRFGQGRMHSWLRCGDSQGTVKPAYDTNY